MAGDLALNMRLSLSPNEFLRGLGQARQGMTQAMAALRDTATAEGIRIGDGLGKLAALRELQGQVGQSRQAFAAAGADIARMSARLRENEERAGAAGRQHQQARENVSSLTEIIRRQQAELARANRAGDSAGAAAIATRIEQSKALLTGARQHAIQVQQEMQQAQRLAIAARSTLQQAEAQAAGLEARWRSSTARLAEMRQELSQAGIKLREVGAEEERLRSRMAGLTSGILNRDQAGMAGQALGIRADAQIQGDITKLEGAFRSLKNSGVASYAEIARAQESLRVRVAALRQELRGPGQTGSAMAALGVRSDAQVRGELQQLRGAFAQLQASGVASYAEIARAQESLRVRVAALRQELRGADLGEQAFSTLGIRSAVQIRGEMDQVRTSYRQLAASGSLSMGELGRAHAAAAQRLAVLRQELRGAGDASRQAATAFGSLRGVIASLGLGVAARSILDAGLAMERARTGMEYVTGSSRGAAREMDWLQQTADRLGLRFTDLAGSYRQISAAARGSTLEGEGIRKVFLSIAQAATVLKMSDMEVHGSLLAITQMISKGTVSAEEFRQQFGERLPGAARLGAQALGVTERQFNKLLETGQIMANTFLPKLATAITQEFGGAVPKAAHSAQAAINRFYNELDRLKDSVAKSGFMDGIIAAMTALRRAMASDGAQSAAVSVGHAIQTVVATIYNLREVLGAVVVGWLAYKGVILAAAAATRIFSAALALTPWGVVSLLIGGAAALYTYYSGESEDAAKATRELGAAAGESAKQVDAAAQASQAAASRTKAAWRQVSDNAATALAAVSKLIEHTENRIKTLETTINARRKRVHDITREQDGYWDDSANAMREALADQMGAIAKHYDWRRTLAAAAGHDEAMAAQQGSGLIAAEWQARLPVMRRYQTEALALEVQRYRQELTLAMRAGENTMEIDRRHLEAKRQILQTSVSEYGGHLDKMRQALSQHVSAANRLESERGQRQEQTTDRLRNLAQRGMTEEQRYASDQAAVQQKIYQAREAARQGDYDKAKRLADQAGGLAESTARAVTQDGREVVSEQQAVATAMAQITEAGQIADKAISGQQSAHASAAQQLGTSIRDAEAAMQSLRGQIQDLDQMLAQERILKIVVSTASIQQDLAAVEQAMAEKSILVGIKPKLEGMEKDLSALSQQAKGGGGDVQIPVSLEGVDKALQELQSAAKSTNARVEADLDTEPARRSMQSLTESIAALPPSSHAITTNATAAMTEIDGLKGHDTSSTHTVTVRKVEEHALGGLTGVAGSGDRLFPRLHGALVPGVGDGDTHPAALPVGSFVVRKSVARALGAPVLRDLLSLRIPRYASGGLVSALLTPGEWVLPPHVVRHYGSGWLAAINDGLLRFAEGGLAGMDRIAGATANPQPLAAANAPFRMDLRLNGQPVSPSMDPQSQLQGLMDSLTNQLRGCPGG